jgi:iron complex outermembrane receptor protein
MHLGIAGRPPGNVSIPTGAGAIKAGSSLLTILFGTFALVSVQAQDAPGEAGRIEEIVVTAQHREERMQDIPITMQAIGGDALLDGRIRTPKDIARMVPGLFMNESALNQTDPEFTLRGVGTNDRVSNQNPAISLYLGGIAVPYNAMVSHALFDMERVEVLKGPQGTLYGRNTTGGAINFIPQRPGTEWGGYFHASYGNRSSTGLEGAIDLPVADTFAVRLAGVVALENGWQTIDTRRFYEDPTDGTLRRNGDIDRRAVRAVSVWQPASEVEMTTVVDAGWDRSQVLAMDHAGNLLNDGSGEFCSFAITGVRDETQCASFARPSSTATLIPVTIGGLDLTVQDANDRGDLVAVSDPFTGARTTIKDFGLPNDIDSDSVGIANTLDWTFDRSLLTAVTGYRSFKRTTGVGQQGGPYKTIGGLSEQDIDVFTQEIRLASDESWDRLTWQGGLYYATEDVHDVLLPDLSEHKDFSAIFYTQLDQDTEALGAFGQMRYALTDDWELVGGLRFTSESRDFENVGTMAGFGPVIVPSFQDQVEDDKLTWRAGANFRPGDDTLIYGSVATGFRGQGFPGSIAFNPDQYLPFEAESITAYEIGFKSTLADGSLQLNAAAYYYDWEDFQASSGVDRNGVRLIVLTNAGDVEVKGAEMDLLWSPAPEWALRLGANWMDSEIVSGDYAGNTTARSPELSLVGLVRYQSEERYGPFRPFVELDYSFTDDVQFQLPNHPGSTGEAYWLFNARVGTDLPGEAWTLALWVQNIGDELYRTEAFGPASTFLPAGILYGPPRSYGASVTYSF